MANFGHGGNAKAISRKNNIEYEKIIDFSANINPLGISEKVKKSIAENINLIQKYPDINYVELKKAIAAFEHIKSESIFLGNGAAEVLFNIIRAVSPKKTLIMAPTFSEYEEAVRSINGSIDYYYLKEENNFNIMEDILDYINEDLDMIIICNPNNPTGTITNKSMLLKILKKSFENNVIMLVDESFLDFTDEGYSLIKYTCEYKNLIIMKSLTKFFALPGLRIGYGISSDTYIREKVNVNTPAWNINVLAEEGAKAAFTDNEYINKTKEYIAEEKNYLYNELKKFKEIKVFKPSVNFIFFKCSSVYDLFSEILKYNVLIRSCSNYNGINSDFYRIAVRTHKENEIFIKILEKILKKHNL